MTLCTVAVRGWETSRLSEASGSTDANDDSSPHTCTSSFLLTFMLDIAIATEYMHTLSQLSIHLTPLCSCAPFNPTKCGWRTRLQRFHAL